MVGIVVSANILFVNSDNGLVNCPVQEELLTFISFVCNVLAEKLFPVLIYN